MGVRGANPNVRWRAARGEKRATLGRIWRVSSDATAARSRVNARLHPRGHARAPRDDGDGERARSGAGGGDRFRATRRGHEARADGHGRAAQYESALAVCERRASRAFVPFRPPRARRGPARRIVHPVRADLPPPPRLDDFPPSLVAVALLAPHDAVVDQYRRVLEEKIELAGVPLDEDDKGVKSGEDETDDEETEDEETEDEESDDDEENDGDESASEAESESDDDSG